MAVPDIVLLVFLGLSTLVGAFRGLVRMLYRLVSTVVSFLIFLFVAPPVAAAIQGFPVFDGPRAAIRDFLLEKVGTVDPQSLQQAVASLGLPEQLRTLVLDGLPASGASTGLVDALSASLFLLALTAAVSLVLFLVAMILLWIATETVEAGLKKIKALDGANHVAGAVLGLVEGLVTVFIVLGLVALAATWVPDVAQAIAGAPVAGFLYGVNPLLFLLS